MDNEREKNNAIYFNEGSFIGAGENCLFERDGTTKLGGILGITDKGYISKEHRSACGIGRKVPATAKYALVREYEIVEYEGTDNNPDPSVYTNLPSSLPEAIPTAVCCYIPVEDVKDIAFVFPIDTIQVGRYSPAGLHNAFFTTHYRNPGGRLQPLNNLVPFRNLKSFSKRVWDFTTTLKGEENKARMHAV